MVLTSVRIYEAGHEVPFYQPLVSLEIFNRSISGLDIATGSEKVDQNYKTVGPATSSYHEGNSTIQFSVVNTTAIYNTTTGEPNPPYRRSRVERAALDSGHYGKVLRPAKL